MSNVISMFDRKKKDSDDQERSSQHETPEDLSWEAIQKKNEENRQRMKKERERANKDVVRSHGLKL